MRKIACVVLAAVVFVSGFYAGNMYWSICKAEASKVEAEETEELVLQTEFESETETERVYDSVDEKESETQSETVAVGKYGIIKKDIKEFRWNSFNRFWCDRTIPGITNGM